ncbi:hypothetical protein AVDCRST_MAG94-2935 [uncultured Leptolyngbya sp.]|uniref:Uncharacterized protein n=1 Tax=uncultured Leptolyngbya sp. TaxID=332963 RepID=A0A6J4MBD2_9CYAN|nr:hypothetical protein AVDCRST_MAG94-2935 [uncultured Leptolyngbya sp.]
MQRYAAMLRSLDPESALISSVSIGPSPVTAEITVTNAWNS